MAYSATLTRPIDTPASFGARFLAYFIDGLVVSIPIIVLVALFGAGIAGAVSTLESADAEMSDAMLASITGAVTLLSGLSMVICYGYFLYTWSIGTSVGMKLLGLRMVRADNGEAPGLGRAIIRLIITMVSAMFFYLGYLWMLWDGQKQTWHDKVAGTVVIVA